MENNLVYSTGINVTTSRHKLPKTNMNGELKFSAKFNRYAIGNNTRDVRIGTAAFINPMVLKQMLLFLNIF